MDRYEGQQLVLEVSDFVALTNQTFEYAFSNLTIRGELANFRVSKGKWVYFDLKDEQSSVKCFTTVYALPGPLEDGMTVMVHGTPRLHPQYGFSITATSIQPVGAGTIRRAADLLQTSLAVEGLFDLERKRTLAYPPSRIGLITSTESAAYADFVKVLAARWGGVLIDCIDVQVQGEAAPTQIVAALEHLNQQMAPPEVIVITRGGGSADDLYAFNTELVTRAVAASRIPTLVAIGHEIDLSLAELAADQRASTPSNAAELLVPDRSEAQARLDNMAERLLTVAISSVRQARQTIAHEQTLLDRALNAALHRERARLDSAKQLLQALDPHAVLRRGYAVVRHNNQAVSRVEQAPIGAELVVTLSDGIFAAKVI